MAKPNPLPPTPIGPMTLADVQDAPHPGLPLPETITIAAPLQQ